MPFPADNPFSEKKRALGDALFHDKRLSVDNSRSCASCHDRAKGFADGEVQGHGVPGRPLKRHTPTLWNLAWARPVFWDGRARSLEEQVAGPIESPDEMAQPMDPVDRAPVGRPGDEARLRRGLPAVAEGRRRQSRQGDRDLRAHLRLARRPGSIAGSRATQGA